MKCPNCKHVFVRAISLVRQECLEDDTRVECPDCKHNDLYMNFHVRWSADAIHTLDDMLATLRKDITNRLTKSAELTDDMRITAVMVVDAFVRECKDD